MTVSILRHIYFGHERTTITSETSENMIRSVLVHPMLTNAKLSIQEPYCITISRGRERIWRGGGNRGEGREEGESRRGPLGFRFYHYRNEVAEGATQPIGSES